MHIHAFDFVWVGGVSATLSCGSIRLHENANGGRLVITSLSRVAIADVSKREERRTETTHAPAKVEAVDVVLVADNRQGDTENPKQKKKNYKDLDSTFEPIHDVDKIV